MIDEKDKKKHEMYDIYQEDDSVVYSKSSEPPKEKLEFRSMIVPEKIIE